MADKEFEIFWVTFQMPKFGSEGKEFDDHEWHMGVSTQGGRHDAEEACKKYHKGCKVLHVLTNTELSADIDKLLKGKADAKEAKKKSKKGK